MLKRETTIAKKEHTKNIFSYKFIFLYCSTKLKINVLLVIKSSWWYSFFHESPNFSLSLLLPFVRREQKFFLFFFISRKRRLFVGYFPEFFYALFLSFNSIVFVWIWWEWNVRLYEINFFWVLSFIANTDFLLLTEETFLLLIFLLLLISILYLGL